VLLLQHPVLYWYLSSSSVVVSQDGWVKRQLCKPLSALFQAAAHLLPTVSRLPLQALFTECSHGEKLLALPPSLVHSKYPILSAACPFQFLVYYSVFWLIFLQDRESVCLGAVLVYPRGGCGSTTGHLFAYLLICISQAGLELASGSIGALLISQCNMAWRSFVQPGGSGCQCFAYSWWFFSAKCGSSISARFFICGDHTVYFIPLVTILNLFLLSSIFDSNISRLLHYLGAQKIFKM
jgi:hypothetical protein